MRIGLPDFGGLHLARAGCEPACTRSLVMDAVEHDCRHLDFLAAGYDTSSRLRTLVAELAAAGAAMTDDHTAMFAGMARTAHDAGFEEIAGWFATPARPATQTSSKHVMNA